MLTPAAVVKIEKLDREVLTQCDLGEPHHLVGILLEHARRLAIAGLVESRDTGEARVFGTLTWTAGGAGSRAQKGDLRELARKMRTLKAPATLRADGHEEPIGGTEQTGGRWRAWYDKDLCE